MLKILSYLTLLASASLTAFSARAEIIYSGDHRNLFLNAETPRATISLAGSDEGWDDLTLQYQAGKKMELIQTRPGRGSHVKVAGKNGMVSLLEAGTVINAALNYTIRPQTFFRQTYSCEYSEPSDHGAFLDTAGYMALQLYSAGQTYFGWARVEPMIRESRTTGLTLRDWAFNSIAGHGLPAGQTTIPEPGSAALLAVCSGSLFFFRRIFMI